jgi:hypothetical protein
VFALRVYYKDLMHVSTHTIACMPPPTWRTSLTLLCWLHFSIITLKLSLSTHPHQPTLSAPPGFLMMCMLSRLPVPLSRMMAVTASSAKWSLSAAGVGGGGGGEGGGGVVQKGGGGALAAECGACNDVPIPTDASVCIQAPLSPFTCEHLAAESDVCADAPVLANAYCVYTSPAAPVHL